VLLVPSPKSHWNFRPVSDPAELPKATAVADSALGGDVMPRFSGMTVGAGAGGGLLALPPPPPQAVSTPAASQAAPSARTRSDLVCMAILPAALGRRFLCGGDSRHEFERRPGSVRLSDEASGDP
jgi:hypothetical protein